MRDHGARIMRFNKKYSIWFTATLILIVPIVLQGQGFVMKEDAASPSIQQDEDRIQQLNASLKAYGIEPEIESIKRYLRLLIPDQETVSTTRKWVAQLQDASYAKRKEASKQLINMPVVTTELVQELLNHSDLEVAFRAQEIFKARSRHTKRIRLAIFEFLIESKAGSVTAELLRVHSQFTDEQVVRAVNRVIKATSETKDLPLLIKHVDQFKKNQSLAMGCLSAVERLDLNQSMDWITSHQKELLNDEFKLHCAEVLAKNKRRECLNIYVELLTADQNRCRYRAFRALKGMTDKSFGYEIGKGANQPDAVTKWREYIASNRGDIKIEHQFGKIRLGRLLVCSYSTGKVSSYDENGVLKWTATGDHPFTCQGLPNGNCLVMFYTKGRLVEYDENGKVVKEFTGLPSSSSGLQRLDNGHTILSSGQSGNKIVEIDEKGKPVWTITLAGTPTSARLQENGLILAALFASNKLVLVDRKGKVQKEIAVKGKPYTANRLENGNILVAFSQGGVAEYSEEGKEIRRVATSSNTYWAEELDDKVIITADSTGILRIGRDGKVISRDDKHTNISYISAY